MNRPLRIVHVEDVESDARLIDNALRAGGIAFSARRVQTREEFLQALQACEPDAILADFKLPTFDGRSALKLAREHLPRTPVIIVTGTMIDEAAVELLHEGAADYILKDRLSRLAPALRRALAAADDARAREATELALQRSELRYRRLFEAAADGILIVDAASAAIVDANPALLQLTELPRERLIGQAVGEVEAFNADAASAQAWRQLLRGEQPRIAHLVLRARSGRPIDVELSGTRYGVDGAAFIQCALREIGQRLRAERRLREQLDELRQFQRLTVDRELRLEALEAELRRLKSGAAE